ncbi:hypothetical protein PMAYCL1PPCAC_09748, partial [Pristionchus mayeri]
PSSRMTRSSSASSDEGSVRRKEASKSPTPRSPSNSPAREKKRDDDEPKKGRSPIRAPSRSPSRSPERRRRSRSRSNERRRRSRSRDRDDKRRERSTSRKRRRTRSRSDSDNRRRRDRSDERRRRRSDSRSPKRTRKEKTPEKVKEPTPEPVKKKEDPADILRSRAGGAYIPPAKLRLMQQQMQDKSSEQYQRLNWERIKKRIHGEVNKVNVGNLVGVVRSLLQENIVRGKGLLCRSIMQAQAFSPGFSNVFAALVAVINSKFPFIGDLLVRRLVVQFKRCFRRGDKGTTVIVTKFIAHLINQEVTHEILGIEISILMLDKPTDDSVEVAIAFIKECGMKLQQVAPRALASVFDRLRSILNEATDLDKRTQYMIESAMAILKDKFQAYPAVVDDLDLIDDEEQVTHMTTLEDATDPENGLNVFKFDPDFEANEAEYEEVRKNVIGDESDSDEEEEEEDDEDDADPGTAADQVAKQAEKMDIIDNSEQALVAFRREIYLTIQSSLDFQEAAHKILKMGIKPQLETELCNMLVDCCAQQRTYDRMYGMLIERFCRLKKEFQDNFEQILKDVYKTIHRFEITKLRNVARLQAHLLFTDAIDWTIFSEVRLNERDSTSSGRIFLKEVFQELSREMGMVKLWQRTVDKTLKSSFSGVFPRDNPEDTRFSINFFTAIGLGALTIDMREWLEKGAKKKKASSDDESSSSSSESDSDSDDDSSDSDSDSSSSSSSSSSDSSDDDKKKKKKKAKKAEKEVKKERKSATPEKRTKDAYRRRSPSREIKREPESDDERRGGRRDERRDDRRRDEGGRRDGRGDERRREERGRGGEERR